MVEFVPAPGLTDDDAIELIRTPPPMDPSQARRGKIAMASESLMRGGANVMSVEDEDEDMAGLGMGSNMGGGDLFHRATNRAIAVST